MDRKARTEKYKGLWSYQPKNPKNVSLNKFVVLKIHVHHLYKESDVKIIFLKGGGLKSLSVEHLQSTSHYFYIISYTAFLSVLTNFRFK